MWKSSRALRPPSRTLVKMVRSACNVKAEYEIAFLSTVYSLFEEPSDNNRSRLIRSQQLQIKSG